MNKIRFLFVLMFILGLLISPVQASSETEGFMPLVLKLDSSMPFRTQAKIEFHRLMPQLIAAQLNRTILGFDPELSAGIIKITFGTRNRAWNLAGIQIFESRQKALALIPHKKLDKRPKREGAFNPEFYILARKPQAFKPGDEWHPERSQRSWRSGGKSGIIWLWPDT